MTQRMTGHLATLTLVLALALTSPARGQTAQELFGQALTLHGALAADSPDPNALRAIRGLLDRIIDEDPASDLAFRILLQDEIEGLDVAALDRLLATAPSALISAPSTAEPEEEPTDPAAPDATSEIATPEPATGTPVETPAPEADEVTVGTEPDTEAPTEAPVQVTGADSEGEPPVPAADAATDLPGLIAQAEALYGQALAAPQAQRPARMAEVQAVLERIVDEHPTSDEAVAVLLGLPLGTIPTAEVAALAATAPATEARTETPENDAAAGVDPVAALSTCYRLALEQGQPVAAAVTITVHAQIGPSGELIGLPTLEIPSTPDATARRMFLNSLAALDLCAPPPGEPLHEVLALTTPPLQPFASRLIALTFDASRAITVSPVVAVITPGSQPVAAAQAPDPGQQPWQSATAQDEALLNLGRGSIREIQTRLTQLSFDPRGVDGAAGPGTRSAIAAWQAATGIPATGFLDARQLDALLGRIETTVSMQPVASASGDWRAATVADQSRLNLTRQDIRDIQARLTVLTFDPRGIDGAAGQGTRNAISDWQRVSGIPATGYLDAPQLAELRRQSEPRLSAWLADPANRRVYEPPPPVPLTPQTVSGRWNYTSTCGRGSRLPGQRITGVIEIVYRGGSSFSGSANNSQGFRGSLSGQVSGRTLNGVIRWGLLIGSTSFTARVSDDARSVSGRDSLGCSLRARKR